MLIDSPVVGDYVIIHAGCAINKIDEATALETIAMVRSLLAAEGGAHDLQ
jgi:hydrogenase expression/formation protein HypC